MAATSNVQHLPAPPDLPRVETGAVQFGSDWPGLFIRGDDAFHLMLLIRRLLNLLTDHPSADVRDTVRQLTGYADTVERDVVVK